MAITAAMVKELREMTDAGMMECKKALTEAEGDMEKAVDILRTRGLAAAAKKAGRATNEGRILAKVCPTCGSAAIVEVNCETDFVAINEKFGEYCSKIASAVILNDPADVDALKVSLFDGEPVDAILTDAIHVIGENMQVRRFKRVAATENGAIVAYNHMNNKIGVLVSFEVEGIDADTEPFQAYGKNVAMQVAAMPPVAANRDAVPADVIEHEMEIYKAQAAESGKPENIQIKIAEGRMEKFYKENCLTEMVYVKDNEKTIQQYTDAVAKELGGSIKVIDFVRFALGE